MNIVKMIIVLILCVSSNAFASEYTRYDLNRIHKEVRETHSKSTPENVIKFIGDSVTIGDGNDFVSEIYVELWMRGLDPKIYMVDVSGSELRHVVTCGGGYCFDIASDKVYSDRVLSRDGITVVVSGKLDESMLQRVVFNKAVASSN